MQKALRARGFSAVELLVVISILLILLSIFVPYLLKAREMDRRVACAENLRQLREALQQYAALNDHDLPRVVYDAAGNPNGYTCFTGADDANPFIPTGVKPNDATASLWLLVRDKLANPASFVCPSTDDVPDELQNASGQRVLPADRGNFRNHYNLSYSYASPFSSAPGYRLTEYQKGDFAIMADKNPGKGGRFGDATAVPFDAPPLKLAIANSPNHNKAGQNVLYADGHVAFQSTPYCGVQQDNIFTALTEKHLGKGQSPPAYGKGFLAPNIGPAWPADSYLVPTADEGP